MRTEGYLSRGNTAEAWSRNLTPPCAFTVWCQSTEVIETLRVSPICWKLHRKTHAYIHHSEKSTKIISTLELIDAMDFFRSVLKFNTLFDVVCNVHHLILCV